MPMLETNRLSVRYGTKTIVDSLSFSVSEGQWLMIAGPNGAGKSTALAAVTQGMGLEDRGAVRECDFLDRRCGQDLLAAHRLIPAGVNAADLMSGRVKRFQTLGGDIRRSHEQNAHYWFPFALRAAARPSSVSS